MKKRTFLHSAPTVLGACIRTLPRPKPLRFPAYTAVLAADLHTDADPWRDRTDVLRLALSGVTRTLGEVDAFVMAGDITNCGDEREYRLLRRLIGRYIRAKAVLPAMGNHDSWHHSDHPNHEIARRLFADLLKNCGHDPAHPYYRYSDRHCTYLVLGTEGLAHNGTRISPAQLEWFSRELLKAVKLDRTTVVVNHQPLAGRNGGDASWAEEGQKQALRRIEEVLCEAAAAAEHPIIFVSGHRHQLSPNCVEKASDRLWFINLPSFEYGGGEKHPGTAAILRFMPEDDTPRISFYDFIRLRPVEPGEE